MVFVLCLFQSVLPLKATAYNHESKEAVKTSSGLTWYSYQTGNWNDPTSWTLDGGLFPLYTNPGNAIPDATDNVIITSGKTITMVSNNVQVNSMQVVGTLNLAATTGHNFVTITGNGRIRLAGSTDNFPLGTATGFVDASTGGTVEIYGTGITLSTIRTFNNLIINLTNTTDIATLATNYTLNGNLTLTRGIFQINDATAANRTLTIFGDVSVANTAGIRVSTANARHEFNLHGDFSNDGGTAYFTQRTTAGATELANEATNGIVDVNLVSATQDQNVVCDGVTRFYRLEINKGIDDTYKATVTASAAANFNLFGAADYDINITQATTNDNALGLIYGTVELGTNVNVPNLNTVGNFAIYAGAQLWINGAAVEKPSGTAIVPYGKLRVSAGSLTADITSGLTLRQNGVIQVDGGSVVARAIRTSVDGVIAQGSYIQSGGTVTLTGNAVSGDYAVFSLTYTGCVFNMSGGTLVVQNRANLGTGSLRGAIFINSDPANFSVTGGTVIMEADNAISYRVTSRVPFWNVILRATSDDRTFELLGTTSGDGGGANEPSLSIQPLIVYNDFTIETNGSNEATFVANNANVTVGGNFEIQNGSVYTHGSNTTTINGAGVSSLIFGSTTATQTFNNLIINKDASTDEAVITTGRAAPDAVIQVNGTLTITQGIFDYGSFVVSAKAGITLAAGVVVGKTSSTGKLLINGTTAQTLSSNNSFIYNLELDNSTTPATALTLTTGELSVYGTLTLTNGVFNIATNRLTMAGASASIPNTGFSTTKMIQTAGNSGDGGLVMYVNANETLIYPIGTNANATIRYTPATVQVQNYADDGYIRIAIEDAFLQLANVAGPNYLTYNWRVLFNSFTTLPTVSYRFIYADSDVNSNENNLRPGKVLTVMPFTRSQDDSNDINTTSNTLTFNGTSNNGAFPGLGFTLESAAYTAGNGIFNGAPQVFYNRETGEQNWNTNGKWSTDGFNGASSAGQYPQEGDVVMMRNTDGSSSNNSWVIMNIDVEVAAVVFDNSGGGWAPRITVQNGRTVSLGVVSGEGEIMVEANGSLPVLNNTDIGDFADQEASMFIYKVENNATYTMYPAFTEYPNLRIEGNDGTNNNGLRVMRNTSSVTINRDLWMDWGGTFRAEANVTINRDLRPGAGGGGGGRFQFGENASHTVTVANDILSTNSANNRIEVINTTPNTRLHTLKVGGDITQTTGIIDLYNGTGTANNAILELNGSTTASYTNASGNTPDLFRLVVNKGSSIGTIFTLADNMTLNGPFDQTSKPLVLQNGLLVLDDPSISYTLTAGGADFNIPGSAGLEVRQGAVATSTTSTLANLTLDGLLRISGGSVNINGGGSTDTNYIEYSNSGNAAIEISSGSLTVAGQLRRQLTSTTSVLRYTQSGGTVLVGNESAGTTTRGVFEVLNTGSQFNHTGGSFTIVRGINSTSVASLLLEPTSYSITSGSTITIGNASTPAGVNSQNIGIQSSVPLNNLTIAGSNNPVVKIYTSPLTISGNLLVSNNTTLNANNQNLTVGGNFTIDGSYVSTSNTTTFNNTSAANISGSTASLNFYNLAKSGAGVLSVSKDLTVNKDLTLSAGTLSTASFSVNLKGNATIDATMTSTSGSGLIFNGTSEQSLTRSNAGTGFLGILTINNGDGVTVPDGNSYNFTIGTGLRLQNGVFDIGGNLLFLTSNATITPVTPYSITNMIQTNSSFTDLGVRKQFPTNYTSNFTFPVGEAAYTPIVFDFSSPTFTTGSGGTPTITVRPANERHPSVVSDAEAPDPEIDDLQNVLQYHWIVNADNVDNTFRSTMTCFYPQSLVSVTAPQTEADYIAARILTDANPTLLINKFSTAEVDENANTVVFTFTGVTDVGITGEYFAGIDNAIPNNVPIYTTNASGNFTDAIYTPAVPGGGAPVGAAVIIRAGDELTLSANGASFYSLQINGSITVNSGTIGHRLGTISGTGNLRIISNTSSIAMPAAVYDDFFSCSGGGLIFGGTGSYEILGGITSLRNLTIEGGDRSLGNNNVNICNDLTINSGSLTNSNNRLITIQNDFLLNGGAFTNGLGTLTITRDLSSNGNFSGGTGGVKTIGRDLLINGGTFAAGSGSGNIIQVNRNMTVAGAATFTGGNTSSSGVKFLFGGSTAQTLTGNLTAGRALNRLEINNSSGLTLAGNVTINSELLLTSGTISPGSNTLLMETGAVANPVEGRATSFVNGRLSKVVPTTDGFTFPIGKGSWWRSGSISNLNVAGDTWYMEYYTGPATAESLVNNLTPVAPILTIASGEYWKVGDGAAVGRTARIGLSWGIESEVSATSAQRQSLQVVLWNDALTRWDNYGGTNFSAGHTQSRGTFNSSSSISFSENIVTLGSTESANPLPVVLTAFSGRNENGFNKIKWSTASELNNDYFELQRSGNGETFTTIGILQGKGTTSALSNYLYDDEAPLVGNNYYRLKQVDFNGAFEYSRIILVTNDSEDAVFNISVFPNPLAEGTLLNIRSIKDNEYEAQVVVRDMTGRVLTSYSVGSETFSERTVDTGTWSGAGIYIVEMTQGKKRVFRRVVVD